MLAQMNDMMVNMPGGAALWAALFFIFGLSVLVFIHEMGHYLAARSVGVAVEAFSIGFGPEIFGWNDRVGTRWKVSLIPLGGYVKLYAMTGEIEPDAVPKKRRHEAFCFKSVPARMWVVFAGPLFNFLFAIFALAGLFMTSGEKIPMPVVGSVAVESPAEVAGLQTGDRVLTINGQPLANWNELSETVRASEGQALTLELQRGETTETVTVTPERREVTSLLGEVSVHYMVGIGQGNVFESREVGVLEATWLGVTRTWDITVMIAKAVWRMLTLQMDADVGGPLTIAKVAGDSASQGWDAFIMFLVFISVNLGLLNLFPIPVLDGGHLVYFAVEAVKGKPLGEKAQEIGYRVGFAMILMLMAFAFYKDIVRIVIPFFSAS